MLTLRSVGITLAITWSLFLFCLLPMKLSAEHDDTGHDHDNISAHDVSAQTQMSVIWNEPMIYCSPYANIWNNSNIPVRYYFDALHNVFRGDFLVRTRDDSDKGWVPMGSSTSLSPPLHIDITGEREGRYSAVGTVKLELKFDFDGDGDFEDKRTVNSEASIEFRIE